MLYLDSSALAKRYFREKGSKSLRARLDRGDMVFTSDLSFAEIHAAIARKYHDGDIGRRSFHRLRNTFADDWLFRLNRVEVNAAATMAAIPRILESLRLRGADAVHLSAAIWLLDLILVGGSPARPDTELEFGVADSKLAAAAVQLGLKVFNPETI